MGGGAPGGDWRQGTKQIHPFSRENCFMLLLYCLTILMHMIFIVLIWFTFFFFYDPDFFGALPAIWCPTQCALCAFAELRHCQWTEQIELNDMKGFFWFSFFCIVCFLCANLL